MHISWRNEEISPSTFHCSMPNAEVDVSNVKQYGIDNWENVQVGEDVCGPGSTRKAC